VRCGRRRNLAGAFIDRIVYRHGSFGEQEACYGYAWRHSMNVTYYVVVPFDRDASGDLTPGAARETTSATAAERGARLLALEHAGAVAFSRTGDPAVGEFQDAVILAQFGDVDLNALCG
jgi:hypothetical protein